MENVKLGLYVSGSGSSAKSLDDKILNGKLSGYSVSALICNKKKAGIYDRNLSVKAQYAKTASEQLKILKENKVDVIVCLGYINIVESEILKEYDGRILNIHPTLLPKYGGKGMYGLATHLAVLESGDYITGVTVHQVNPQYDEGSIIDQWRLVVPENLRGKATEENAKELQKIVLNTEYEIMPYVLRNNYQHFHVLSKLSK